MMNGFAESYQNGLAAAMLEEGVIRLEPSEDGHGVGVYVDKDVMGQPGSPLWEIAVFGLSAEVRKSGLVQDKDAAPGVVALDHMRPPVDRVIKEVSGRKQEWADEQPNIEEMDLLTAEYPPALIFDARLDESSLELAKAANRYGQVVGMIALLDMQQRGIRTALREEADVPSVFSVIRYGDVIRYMLRTNHSSLTQREYISILRSLDTE